MCVGTKIEKIILLLMMPFSTGTGLEGVGIAEPGLELSFPKTAPTDDALFNRNWAGGWWNRWARIGTVAGSGCFAPLKKQVTKGIGGGSSAASPMPKSVLP